MIAAMINLLKLCVGADSVEDLLDWQTSQRPHWPEGRSIHVTRMWPKREADLLDGGSLYWVVRGVIRCRQELVGFEEDVDDEDGKKYCKIKVKRTLIQTAPRACKAFQGWRYLEPERAPPDLSQGDTADMPAEMAAELKRLGLL